MKKNTAVLAIAICVLCVSSAQAALLGIYDFTTETAAPSVTSGTFTPFARQNVTPSTPSAVFNSSAWNTTANIDSSEYVQFSIAPTSGHSVTITDLALDALSSKFSGSHSGGPTSIIMQIFAGALGAGIGNANSVLASTTFTVTANDQSQHLNWDFNDLTDTSGYTFRFYGLSAENPAGTLSFDNVTLNGLIATVVPEPVTYAMAIFGLVFVCGGVGRFYLDRKRQKA